MPSPRSRPNAVDTPDDREASVGGTTRLCPLSTAEIAPGDFRPGTPTARGSSRVEPRPPNAYGRQIVDLLFSGVLPRHPDLKFVSVESGIGFLPSLLEACDYTFNCGMVGRDRPEFKLLPSECFARQVYGCFWFEEYATAHMLDTLPVDNLL